MVKLSKLLIKGEKYMKKTEEKKPNKRPVLSRAQEKRETEDMIEEALIMSFEFGFNDEDEEEYEDDEYEYEDEEEF